VARRSVWLVTGVVAGAASSLYAERRLKRTLEAASARLAPDALVTEVGRSARQAARSTGGRVREAVATGRNAMQRREDELWADLAASGASAVPDGTGAVAAPAAAPAPTAVSAGPVEHAGRTGRRRRARRSPSHLGK
jgi:hypothetical protein